MEENILLITRFCDHRWGTFGEVTYNGKFLGYSLEQPWANNLAFHSCVPCGEYGLKPFSSDKHPDTFSIFNPDLNVFTNKNPTGGRYACLLHAGNWVTNFEGCIGFGEALSMAIDPKDGVKKWMITNSAHTVENILSLIREQGITKLKIIRRP